MENHGRCSNVRPAITEAICEEMRGRKARVCEGCPGPAAPVEGATEAKYPATAAIVKMRAAAAEVEAQPEAQAAPVSTPGQAIGFFVDCTGHEELLQVYQEAVESRGLDLSGSVLDLMHLFNEGRLVLLEEE